MCAHAQAHMWSVDWLTLSHATHPPSLTWPVQLCSQWNPGNCGWRVSMSMLPAVHMDSALLAKHAGHVLLSVTFKILTAVTWLHGQNLLGCFLSIVFVSRACITWHGKFVKPENELKIACRVVRRNVASEWKICSKKFKENIIFAMQSCEIGQANVGTVWWTPVRYWKVMKSSGTGNYCIHTGAISSIIGFVEDAEDVILNPFTNTKVVNWEKGKITAVEELIPSRLPLTVP